MADSDKSPPTSSQNQPPPTRAKTWPFFTFFTVVLLPVAIAMILYQLEDFDPAPYPTDELTRKESLFVPKKNSNMLQGSEKIGLGHLLSPEDIAYDHKTGAIYTGCVDGWISRVTVNESAADSVVEKWVNTGGRPLGVVHGHHGEVIVADPDKGLLNISSSGAIELLADEAEGLKFKLTDAVDIANDGMLYFTDASYKYNFSQFIFDIFEARPYGRLLSYNPSTRETKVLVRDLYFANGVAVSPDQNFVIFCETPMRRCKKYYIQGERKGSIDTFIDNLPGMPDNILYDGEGHYWIALSTEVTYPWELAQRYPFIRKIMAIMEKYIGRPHVEKNGGALSVDLHERPMAHYHDSDLSLVSSAVKIGEHLYCGSVVLPYILRLNLNQHPAVPAT